MMVFFMKISVNRLITGALTVLVYAVIWFMLTSRFSYALESDINCLKAVKASVEDPLNYLSSWDFNNNTEGFICKFTGIDCWHPDESKVLNIRLSDMELKGEFPRGLQNCSALTGLDLSSNKFFGSIPSDISKILQYVTSLDLSSNNFSGAIPKGLANCTYLYILKLDSNKLSGQIPLELSLLNRLGTFSAANNLLSGQIPNFNITTFPAENYANNAGLCGGPLPACQGVSKKTHPGVLLGAAVGGALTFLLF